MVGGKKASGSSTLAKPGVKNLEKSANRAQVFLDEAPIGISNVDLKGKITYVNKRFEEVSGYSREEVVGKNGFRLGMFSQEALKLFAKRMKDRLMGKPPGLLEMQFKCKDGHWIWIAIEGRLLRERGIPVGFQLISRDITERKQAEEELQESEEKYRTLVEDALVGIMHVDITGKITYVNKTILEATGYSWEEMVGKNAFSLGLVSSEVVKVLRKRLKEKLMGQPPGLLEIQYKRKNGEWIWLQIRGKVIRKGGLPVGIQIIGEEITERKKAEEALRESEERYRKLFESTFDMIQSIAPDGHIVFVNRAWLRTMGYTEEELPSLNLFQIIHPDYMDHCRELFTKVISGESVTNIQVAFVAKDGRKVLVEGNATPRLIGGKVVATQGFFRDVTERKRAEKDLREAQERLLRSEKLAAIGQLASGVSHELRNPLVAIKNAVLYVRRRLNKSKISSSEPKVLEFLDIMDEEVDSANKVITDLLSFSRVAKPTVSLINVGSIIRDALNRVAVPENIRLTVDVKPALLMVTVDAVQIRQVFINIILNAAEAMPQGGRLEIRARGEADLVTVEFADTGCGIPESVADKIFDPLFTTKPRGVGLGLAMCRSIIERHGGDIGVKSKEGKGTTLILSLPTRVG